MIWLCALLTLVSCEELAVYERIHEGHVVEFDDRRFVFSRQDQTLYMDKDGQRQTVAVKGKGPDSLTRVSRIDRAENRVVAISSHRLQWFSMEGRFLKQQKLPRVIFNPREKFTAGNWQIFKVIDGFIAGQIGGGENLEVIWLSEDGRRSERLVSFKNANFKPLGTKVDPFNPLLTPPFISVSLDRKWATTFVPQTSRVFVFDMVAKKVFAEHQFDVERIPLDKEIFKKQIENQKRFMKKYLKKGMGQTSVEELPKYLPAICSTRFGLNGELLVRTGHPTQFSKSLAFTREGKPLGDYDLDPTLLFKVITERDGRFLVITYLDDDPCLTWKTREEAEQFFQVAR